MYRIGGNVQVSSAEKNFAEAYTKPRTMAPPTMKMIMA